jgi:hypothetical protein
MKPTDNSLHDILQELMRTHANSIEILSKFSEAFTSNSESVTVNLKTDSGQTTSYQVPSLGFLQSEVKRLEENVRGLAGLDAGSANIRLEDGTFKRIMTSSTNQEPSRIGNVTVPNSFSRRNNWFFDNFINPMLMVSFDVSNFVSSNIRNVWYRRVIVNTDTDEKRQVFDDNIKGRNDIEYETLMLFLNARSINHFVDEDEYRFPPSISQFTGTFDVISILNTDTASNGNIRSYRLNKLTYTNNLSLNVDTEVLKIGDIVATKGGARYRVDEVNKIENTVRLNLTSGYELISIGIDILYIISDALTIRQVEVSVGHDERQVIFFRPVDSGTQVASTKWSPGVGIYSSELRIRTADSEMSLDDYYKKYCIDFGIQLLDAAKNKPVPKILSIKPDAPTLRTEDFKVLVINEHKTQSQDSETLRQKFSEKTRLQSEILQLDSAISKTKEEFQASNNATSFDKRALANKLSTLIEKRNSLSSLYGTTVRELGALSTTTIASESPKYRIRGFFPIPSPKVETKSGRQQIIQFIVQYRYLRLDGTAAGPKSFEFVDSSGNNLKGYYSEWNEVQGPVRQQIYDEISQRYVWANEDVNDADAVNINQVDIPISPNEKVEIRAASVSEAGYPTNLTKSDYSENITITFPTELISSDEVSLLRETQMELNKVEVLEDLNSKGLDIILNNIFTQGDQVFVAKGESVASGFVSDAGSAVSVYEKFKAMEQQISMLNSMVTSGRGKIDVYLLDESNNRYSISNGGAVELNAGFYSEIVQQFPQSERKGAIVTMKYCIVIENLNPTPLELVTRFPGGINQKLQTLYGTGNSEYSGRNYHLAPLLYNDVPLELLTRSSAYWNAPYMSSQVPSQYAYLRGRGLGLTQSDELYKSLSDRALYPSWYFNNTNGTVQDEFFIWNNTYTYTGEETGSYIPNTTNYATDFCIHIDHPEIRTGKEVKYSTLVYPQVSPSTTNQVNPRIRHSELFYLKIEETDGTKQLAYKSAEWFQNRTPDTYYTETTQITGDANLKAVLANYQDKLGFYPNDRYLIGKKTCGSYLMVAPASTQQLMVNGTDYRSNYILHQGEDNAIRIPVLFQFRMTDYFGVGNTGTGKVGGFDSESPSSNLSNVTYGKKIGMDIFVKDEGTFSFDLTVKASYKRESLTQVIQSPGFIDRTRRTIKDFFS